MKISVVSDLHLEFQPPYTEKNTNYEKMLKLAPDKETVLVLAGDISSLSLNDTKKYKQKHYQEFIKYCSENYKQVFLVAGNHEFYDSEVETVYSYLEDLCSEYENVVFMNKKTFIYEDVLFIGCTLWSEATISEYETYYCNDFRKIYVTEKDGKTRKLTLHDYNKLHYENIRWLEDLLESELFKTNTLPIVVITHYLPSYKLIDDKYKGMDSNCLFASHYDHLIKLINAKYWIHGHTHTKGVHKIEETFCVVNPVGYPGENKDYTGEYLLEI